MIIMGQVLKQLASLEPNSIREALVLPYPDEDVVMVELEAALMRVLFAGGTAIVAKDWDSAMELRNSIL